MGTSAFANGRSSLGAATVPAGRPGALGLVRAECGAGRRSQGVVAQPGGTAEAAGHRELVAAGRRVEIDHADDGAAFALAHVSHVVGGAELAVFPRAEGDEHDGVGRGLLREPSGRLEQQADAGGVVGVSAACGDGVVVGADDESLGGHTVLDGDNIGGVHSALAAGGDELLEQRVVAVLLQGAGEELARADLAPGVARALAYVPGEHFGAGEGDGADGESETAADGLPVCTAGCRRPLKAPPAARPMTTRTAAAATASRPPRVLSAPMSPALERGGPRRPPGRGRTRGRRAHRRGSERRGRRG